MKIFITGTDTDVGKTVVSSWLCLHTGYDYFKPIQTGNKLGTDSETVKNLTSVNIHHEIYNYPEPLSPHLAASLENDEINLQKMVLPATSKLIVEGAGGVLVPINKKYLMIDLIKQFAIPVILVARTTLGTINHTLLSIAALRNQSIPLLGIIMNGVYNEENKQAIEFYGDTSVLATIPALTEITQFSLLNIPLSIRLKSILGAV